MTKRRNASNYLVDFKLCYNNNNNNNNLNIFMQDCCFSFKKKTAINAGPVKHKDSYSTRFFEIALSNTACTTQKSLSDAGDLPAFSRPFIKVEDQTFSEFVGSADSAIR